jgi:hypothetical protein
LNIGVTGHQTLMPGQRWEWVETQIRSILTRTSADAVAWSSLAPGADQLFAAVSDTLGIPLHIVIPFPDYAERLSPDDRLVFDRLSHAARSLETLGSADSDPETAFAAAGHYIIERVDVVLAIFDKEHHRGHGGTGDMVDYARSLGRPLFTLDPRSETVSST